MVSHNIKSTAMVNKDDLLLLLCVIFLVGEVQTNDLNSLNRSSFPAGFIFGMSSSAYQSEGAAHEGGKGQSIWDTFTEKYPDKMDDRSSGLVAEDTYHRYKEDIHLLKDMGLDAYRISISWPRLLPRGKLSGGVNQEGIAYYNNLINEILSNGLLPFVAIFHWDVPQSLEDEYGGFLSHQIVNDFRHYAELCFRTYGDRVKHWITVNEPVYFTSSGYANGKHAPGRCSKWSSGNCTEGDSGTEPYLVLHNLLLAHAAAVKLYRQKYQMTQKGQIGFTINIRWAEPQNQRTEDYIAVTRYFAFSYGWFLEPLKSGCYPVEMVNIVNDRLPKFTKIQSLMVKGSFDFIGVNYYTALYASDGRPCQTQNLSYMTDSCVNTSYDRNGNLIGEEAASEWLHIYPRGIKNTLVYLKQKFKNPIIYVTENGIDEVNNHKISLEDNARVKYHTSHLFYINRAIIENNVDVRGYFAWTFLDDFEWSEGYTVRFGFYYVDYKDGLKRYPKRSVKWFKRFLEFKRK